MSATIRLPKEFNRFEKEPMDNITFAMDPANMLQWTFTLEGPKGSPYEGKTYKGVIEFTKDYPLRAPKVRFTTVPFHPNVYTNGKVCISILHEGVDETGYESTNERWSPVLSVRTIFLSIFTLFYDPNPDSPANIDAAVLYRKDKEAFKMHIQSSS